MTIQVTNDTDLGTLMFSIPPMSVAFRQYNAMCERRAEELAEFAAWEAEVALAKLRHKDKGKRRRKGVPLFHVAWMFVMSFVLGMALCLLIK